MSYKWKPNASQRRAFAEKMQDPQEKEDYEERKRAKKNYDNWKDKDFVPTKEQNDFVMQNRSLFVAPEEEDAANQIVYGYGCKEKIPHKYIHIINEKRRSK
jgi:ATP-dependent helicase YprA (DUF1998 family)